MSSQAAIAELRKTLPADRIVTDPAELFVYESDGFTVAKARPAAVVFPTSTEEVVSIVKVLGRHDVHIVPRGSGTGLTGACVAYESGILVCTARMNRVLGIDLDNRVAHVEAGVRNTQLSDAVAATPAGTGWHFAPDPSSQRASSIGGNASTNAGGIHTLKDFCTSNHVLGMEMVLADGSVLRAGAGNGCYEAGPIDLPGLICAHEGTLGIIASLWVRLAPKPAAFRTLIGMFSAVADAGNTVSDIIASGLLPAAMEMMDGAMICAVEDAFHFGFPRTAAALLLIEIDGPEPLLDGQMNDVIGICKRNNAMSVESSSDPQRRAALWKARKSAFGAVGRLSHSYCTQDACIPRSLLAQTLERIDQIGRESGLQITNVFHAGDGNIHPIFLYDDRDEEQVQRTLRAADRILTYAVDIGGTLTGEHGVGVEKLHLMPYQFDEATMRQFAGVKAAFDPDQRINAGKLLPSPKLVVRLQKPGRQAPQ